MEKKRNKIPRFKNKGEEARFWDTHSLADYWDKFDDFNLALELNRPKQETLVLRVQKKVKNELERAAKKKRLSVSSLARMWLTEKLQSTPL